VAQVRSPGGAFSGFQYLTVPLHLFAQDRAFILEAMNQAVSRLYVQEEAEGQAA
jgi:hypothetical protein